MRNHNKSYRRSWNMFLKKGGGGPCLLLQLHPKSTDGKKTPIQQKNTATNCKRVICDEGNEFLIWLSASLTPACLFPWGKSHSAHCRLCPRVSVHANVSEEITAASFSQSSRLCYYCLFIRSFKFLSWLYNGFKRSAWFSSEIWFQLIRLIILPAPSQTFAASGNRT